MEIKEINKWKEISVKTKDEDLKKSIEEKILLLKDNKIIIKDDGTS
jgi:hypothetical protein